MNDIIFEYTSCSIYASQGSSPSTDEGYDIWLKNEDRSMDFLGFCALYELEKHMKFYQDQGDHIYIRRKPIS
jgi:hypothetical protein